MDGKSMLKWLAGLAVAASLVISGLIYLPRLVNVEVHKSYVEGKLEEISGFEVSVAGPMELTLFPRFSVVLSDIAVRENNDPDAPVFLRMEKLYIGLHSLDALKGDIKIEDVVISGGALDLGEYRSVGSESAAEFLKGRLFKSLMLRSSRVRLDEDSVVEDINFNITPVYGRGIKAEGALTYRGVGIEGVKGSLAYDDPTNFSLSLDMEYARLRNSTRVHLTLSSKEGVKSTWGDLSIESTNLTDFARELGITARLPDIGLLKNKISLRSDVLMTDQRISFSKGTLRSSETTGEWAAEIPLERSERDRLVPVPNRAALTIDFTTMKLSKFAFVPARNPAADIMGLVDSNRDMADFLRRVSLRLSARNVLLQRGVAKNLSFASAPVMAGDVPTGFEASRLVYNIGDEGFDGSFRVITFGGETTVSAKVKNSPEFDLPNSATKSPAVKKFRGSLLANSAKVEVSDAEAMLGPSLVKGSASWRRDASGRNEYSFKLSGAAVDLPAIFGAEANLELVIAKLASLSPAVLNIEAEAARANLGAGGALGNLRLKARFADADLVVEDMRFSEEGRESNISGSLDGLAGGAPRFRDFNYRISGRSLGSTTIPLVGDSLIASFLKNGVSSIDIRLDGAASDPDTAISASAQGMDVKISGRIFGDRSRYGIELTHGELKGFLYAFGFIDDTLAPYLYDNIPFRLTGTVDKGGIYDLRLSIRDQEFTGEIRRADISRVKDEETFETSVLLKSDSFDSRRLLKRLGDTDAYADLLLRIIRVLPANIRIECARLASYDGAVYDNFILDLGLTRNPGRLALALERSGQKLSLDSSILNSRIFGGSLRLKDYRIPGPLTSNGLVDIRSGSLDVELKFDTNGLSMRQLVSNLSGSFAAAIEGGAIDGISDYDSILSSITGLANITTNNVIYILDSSFRDGRLSFARLEARGAIKDAAVEKAAFSIEAKNMSASGSFSTDLVKKSLDIDAEVALRELSLDSLVFRYVARGFANNLSVVIDTSALAGRINLSYLQKRKK